jgi:peptidoglycan/xylan/chitin deacetylase (PgdA/CDA1 family)
VVAEDWEPERSPEDVAGDVLNGAAAVGDGTVVLLHAWPASTLEAVPDILRSIRDRNARLVTVADLADRDLTALANPQTVAENP